MPDSASMPACPWETVNATRSSQGSPASTSSSTPSPVSRRTTPRVRTRTTSPGQPLSGIPGSTGATPVQNVGAYGQEVAVRITAVRVYDRAAGAERVFGPAELGFAYRDSRLKQQPGAYVVLAVTFALRSSAQASAVCYAELAMKLAVELGDTAPLADVRAAVLELRRGKGMVLDPADPDSRSAGSFFTNPVVPVAATTGSPR